MKLVPSGTTRPAIQTPLRQQCTDFVSIQTIPDRISVAPATGRFPVSHQTFIIHRLKLKTDMEWRRKEPPVFTLKKSVLSLLMLSAIAAADPIAIPNFSFEMPPVTRDDQNPFGALPYIDDWDETLVGPADEFDQNTGVFLNTDPGSPDRITNANSDRLAFMSSLIGNTIRQNLAATYQVGQGYEFTVAIGKSSTFPVGSTEQLQVALFYVNGGSEQIIASTMVSGSSVGTTTLSDISVTLQNVAPGDPWAGQPVGVMVRPAVTDNDNDGEGFWNIDFARLERTPPIPAASTWGLVALSLMMLNLGTLLLGRKKKCPALA
jgi:hypothetical protein